MDHSDTLILTFVRDLCSLENVVRAAHTGIDYETYSDDPEENAKAGRDFIDRVTRPYIDGHWSSSINDDDRERLNCVLLVDENDARDVRAAAARIYVCALVLEWMTSRSEVLYPFADRFIVALVFSVGGLGQLNGTLVACAFLDHMIERHTDEHSIVLMRIAQASMLCWAAGDAIAVGTAFGLRPRPTEHSYERYCQHVADILFLLAKEPRSWEPPLPRLDLLHRLVATSEATGWRFLKRFDRSDAESDGPN